MHCQLPQLQSSTTTAAVIKHKRALEDALLNAKLDVSTPVLLRFTKPESAKTDSRRLAQACLAVTSTIYKSNGFADCEACRQSTIGPLPLIKTSAMLGYDVEDGSLSAGLRTEQYPGGVSRFNRLMMMFWGPAQITNTLLQPF